MVYHRFGRCARFNCLHLQLLTPLIAVNIGKKFSRLAALVQRPSSLRQGSLLSVQKFRPSVPALVAEIVVRRQGDLVELC